MSEKLAIEGGKKAVKGYPPRGLFDQREKKAVVALFDNAIKTGNAPGYNGPVEEAYCKDFAKFLGGGYCDAVNSGTSAVYVALKSVRPKAFSEVLCGPVSDPGGIMPIALAGCIPVPVDAEPGGFNMDPASLEKRITKRTGAIIVAHIAGIPADMDAIMKIAKAKNIPVVEDCAQAHGAKYKGKFVGTIGDVGAFSTMFGKHHCTGGQGGVVFTKSEEIYWNARRFSDRGKPFGLEGTRGNVVASQNLNLSELGGCIGRVQIKKLPAIIKQRRKMAKTLIDGVKKECKAVRIVEGPKNTDPVYWFLFVQLDLSKLTVDKAAFVAALQAEGLPVGASYLHLFTEQDWYINRNVFEGTDYPWGSPLYKGNPDRKYPVPNIRATDKYTCQLHWHEGLRAANVKEILAAIKKVEAAYLK